MRREKNLFIYIFVASFRYNHFQYLQISPFHHRQQQQQQLSSGSSSNVPASKEEHKRDERNETKPESMVSFFLHYTTNRKNCSLNGETKKERERTCT